MLAELPDAISVLKDLRKLMLAQNCLERLPSDLAECRALTQVTPCAAPSQHSEHKAVGTLPGKLIVTMAGILTMALAVTLTGTLAVTL